MGDLMPYRPRMQPPVPDTRTRIEGALALAPDAVDQLVAALDDIDGDPDIEDGGYAEASLGAPEGHEHTKERAGTAAIEFQDRCLKPLGHPSRPSPERGPRPAMRG